MGQSKKKMLDRATAIIVMGVASGCGYDVTCHMQLEAQGLAKEEERLIRRISAGYPNGGIKTSPEKRRSIQ